MVVIAIIALLIAVLLPSFNAVRQRARETQARSQFSALDAGLEMFRSEQSLGSTYPPSASDNRDDRQLISNPKRSRPTENNNGQENIRVAGAHLLVQAMIGADGLGTPGFLDVNRDGFWWDDTHDTFEQNNPAKSGLYAIDPNTGRTAHTRYGGAGYVDDKMKERTETLQEMFDEGKLLNLDTAPQDVARDEWMFMDPWDTPILYYRASAASIRIVGDASQTGPAGNGIYWQEDNGLITGTESGPLAFEGLDFGAGKVDGQYHALYHNEAPEPTQKIQDLVDEEHFEFARFILDPSIKARPTPVRKDSYLLISAGPDARYGTDDDVTNWTRKVD